MAFPGPGQCTVHQIPCLGHPKHQRSLPEAKARPREQAHTLWEFSVVTATGMVTRGIATQTRTAARTQPQNTHRPPADTLATGFSTRPPQCPPEHLARHTRADTQERYHRIADRRGMAGSRISNAAAPVRSPPAGGRRQSEWAIGAATPSARASLAARLDVPAQTGEVVPARARAPMQLRLPRARSTTTRRRQQRRRSS